MKSRVIATLVFLMMPIPAFCSEYDHQRYFRGYGAKVGSLTASGFSPNDDISRIGPAIKNKANCPPALFFLNGEASSMASSKARREENVRRAKEGLAELPKEGPVREALVRLLARLVTLEKADVESREYAYVKLKEFAADDANAKEWLAEARKFVKARDGDPFASKLE